MCMCVCMLPLECPNPQDQDRDRYLALLARHPGIPASQRNFRARFRWSSYLVEPPQSTGGRSNMRVWECGGHEEAAESNCFQFPPGLSYATLESLTTNTENLHGALEHANS